MRGAASEGRGRGTRARSRTVVIFLKLYCMVAMVAEFGSGARCSACQRMPRLERRQPSVKGSASAFSREKRGRRLRERASGGGGGG